MKHLLLRLQRYQALRRARRREQPALSVYEEMYRGSLIGLVVCVLFAITIGGLSGPALWVALLGASLGALNGLLLWLGSDHFDEQPIPPHRPRWRTEPGMPLRTSPGWLPRHANSRSRLARPRRQRQP